MPKVADAQAAAEKAAIMSAGAFLGARHFGSAGTLSLDEIFSPVQLLVDWEIRDWVQRAVRGLDIAASDDQDAWLDEIRAGLQRGFMGLDSTLADYMLSKETLDRGLTWYPRFFLRNAIGAWDVAGRPELNDRLRDEVRARIARHDYELDADRRREVERIYRAARADI
jgi:trimethylamine:corrinoid methyltransferase-like protein